MLVIHHPDQALHDPEQVFRHGKFLPQPDRAERYHRFLAAARDGAHEIIDAPMSDLAPILAVHDRDYIEFLRTAYDRWRALPDAGDVAIPSVHPTARMRRKPTDLIGELGYYSNSTSCPIDAGTWRAALASASSAIYAADRLIQDGGVVYALCRPPGHHAYAALMSGVCYFNNVAIATERLRKRFNRVAIFDIDVHHGNGTQDIFYRRGDILFASIHVDPALAAPFYAGYADETGDGAGAGLTFNQPLAMGADDRIFLTAVDRALTRIRDFGVDAIAVSMGLDASAHDPVATFRVSHEGFAETMRRVKALGRPTLLVQEGGYLNPELGACLRSALAAWRS